MCEDTWQKNNWVFEDMVCRINRVSALGVKWAGAGPPSLVGHFWIHSECSESYQRAFHWDCLCKRSPRLLLGNGFGWWEGHQSECGKSMRGGYDSWKRGDDQGNPSLDSLSTRQDNVYVQGRRVGQ